MVRSPGGEPPERRQSCLPKRVGWQRHHVTDTSPRRCLIDPEARDPVPTAPPGYRGAPGEGRRPPTSTERRSEEERRKGPVASATGRSIHRGRRVRPQSARSKSSCLHLGSAVFALLAISLASRVGCVRARRASRRYASARSPVTHLDLPKERLVGERAASPLHRWSDEDVAPMMSQRPRTPESHPDDVPG